MKKVLVIIPHFNHLSLLKKCLEHLKNQSSTDFDIMIVDNGSSDGSEEYIFDLTSAKKIHSIMLSENMGFAYAVNCGIKYGISNDYEYSLLLNNDAYVTENFVDNLVKKISTKKKLFAASALMLQYRDNDKIDSFGDYYTIFGWGFQGNLLESPKNIESDTQPFSACAGAAIYRNSVFKKIGYFDEMFFAYLEDMDISYRARLFGYSITTCKDAICYHLGSATTGSKYNKFKVMTSARNNIYLIYKNMPIIQIIINIIPLLIGTLIKFIYFVFKGFGLDFLSGTISGFKNLYLLNKVTLPHANIFRYIHIEFYLIKSTILYIQNFINRHK